MEFCKKNVVSNTTNHLKVIPFVQMIIKRHCRAREQATSLFLFFFLEGPNAIILYLYLYPLSLSKVI